MSNTISNLNTASLTQTSSVADHSSAKSAHGTTTKAPLSAPQDGASLSSTSTLLSHALKISDARTEKVAGLQQAIAAGVYHVPSGAVAGKLLQSLLG